MILPPSFGIGICSRLGNKSIILSYNAKIDSIALLNTTYYSIIKASILFGIIKLINYYSYMY